MFNRFENDDNFDFEDETFEDYMVDPSDMVMPAELNKFRQEEISIVTQKVNTAVLKQATEIVKNSWFWKFRTLGSKMDVLTKTYYALLDLVTD